MEFFWITGTPKGRLATATRPRGGDWLIDDMRDAARRQVACLVSMLTHQEQVELDLLMEPSAAKDAGIAFLNVPVDDRGVPVRAAPFAEAVTDATDRLCAGTSVVVHCRMGVGRSSMFAAACLVRLGIDADAAWPLIAAVRGRPVPDVDTQRDWLRASQKLMRD
ncbi:MAG: tyrosine protein phosphatase [Deltaproteobacteria bacterium]|nr:tyrosine protein phosphatase [Deltaproteobacteria bacterium]